MLKPLYHKRSENFIPLVLLFLFTCILLFFTSKMSPFYPYQEWCDVNLYFTIGKGMLNGLTPYKDLFDHKGPLIFVIYGLGYLISSDSFTGVFILQIVAWCISVLGVYFTSRLFLNSIASILTSALFVILVLPHVSEGGSAEEFILPAISISNYLFISFFHSDKKISPTTTILQGFLWAFVLFIKFSWVCFWIFPLLGVLYHYMQSKEFSALFKFILYFTLGVLVLTIPIIIYFLINKGLNDFIDSYVLLNVTSKVDSEGNKGLVSALKRGLYLSAKFEPVQLFFLLIGSFGLPIIITKNNIIRTLLSIGFFLCFFMAFIGGYIFYYSIPYYIYASWGIIAVFYCISKILNIYNVAISKKLYILITPLLLIGLILWGIYSNGNYKAKQIQKNSIVDSFKPYIINDTDKSLLTLSLDDATALFTYADILPNIKYFTTPNLLHDAYPIMRDTQTEYIKNKATQFVILAEYTNNADYFKNLEALNENYEVIAIYKEFYAWHNTDRYFYLYKRKQ